MKMTAQRQSEIYKEIEAAIKRHPDRSWRARALAWFLLEELGVPNDQQVPFLTEIGIAAVAKDFGEFKIDITITPLKPTLN